MTAAHTEALSQMDEASTPMTRINVWQRWRFAPGYIPKGRINTKLNVTAVAAVAMPGRLPQETSVG